MQPFGPEDLYAAVADGVITPEAAARLQHFLATRARAAPVGAQAAAPGQVALAGPDDEAVHFLTGFNDVFVSIAVALTLLALYMVAGYAALGTGGYEAPSWMHEVRIQAACTAAASWGLAEYFTRRRRMALPSILLMLGFVLPSGMVAYSAAMLYMASGPISDARFVLAVMAMSGCAAAAVAATLHWLRFGVPMTVAVGMASVLAAVLAALDRAAPWLPASLTVFVSGLLLFASAIWWDVRDPMRRTIRSDVAFWLHLVSAPLMVQPAFSVLGFSFVTPLVDGDAGMPASPVAMGMILAALAIGLYVVLAIVALILDRRALLASALACVLYAMSTLLSGAGLGTVGFAVTGLLVGAGLLLLSAFWAAARAVVLSYLPSRVRVRLPPAR